MSDLYDSIEFDTIEYLATSGSLGVADSDARIIYYGNNGLPHVLFNGGNMLVGAGEDVIDGAVYDPIVQNILAQATILELSISSFSFDNPGAHVTVELNLEGDLANLSQTKLRVAVLEDGLFNSSVTYDNVLRDMLPDQALTIDQNGQSQQITINFTSDASWDLANVRLLAFVQDDSNKEVLQSCNTRPVPDYSMRYYALGERTVIESGSVLFEQSALFNTGLLADTYDITLDTSSLPAGWSGRFNYAGTDYSTLSLALDPDSRAVLNVSVETATPGSGDVILTFHSQSGLVADRSITYKVITPEVKILLVDDDGGTNFETLYFEPAIASTGKISATWDRTTGAPSHAFLSHFDLVIWQCGWAFPSVDADDRAVIAEYLDGGGNLFIDGQDIGWEMDAGGSATLAWYNNYLHAEYIADDTNMLLLEGVSGDPITDGLSLSISGGDGADNQQYPSDIDPLGTGASTILTYDAERNGGIKADTGTYKVVYLSFGFEAINNASDRAALMQGIINWLLPSSSPAGEGMPAALAMRGNVPNPFNPMTEIRFSLAVEAQVRLGVYDVKGHLVRLLDESIRTAGDHSIIWDGKDHSGQALSSGTYFCRVESAGKSESVKMMLIR